MMTCIKIGRIGNVCCSGERFPRWAAEWIFHTAGGATPGRGGRRKRRRRWHFGITDDFVMALAEDDPPVLGYRERRRRAKLRRRRARARQTSGANIRYKRANVAKRLSDARCEQAFWSGSRKESEWVKNRMARTI